MLSERAASLLRRTESEIADLATEASRERRYDVATQLLSIARNLASTADRLAAPTKTNAAAAQDLPADASPSVLSSASAGDDDGIDAPVFERDGDELIKCSSKDGAKGYEHKSPRSTVDLLLHAINEKSTKRGEFRTSRVLPLTDSHGKEVPSYQGYLCLRWLRTIGLVQRVARQRYQLVQGSDPAAVVEAAWQSLHQR